MTPAASGHLLRAADRTLEVGERPWLMGIVNASPDSFSEGGMREDVGERVALAAELLDAGADIIDVGGESAITRRPPVEPAVELRRVIPVIERIAGELGALVSVDTYKPEVARAAVSAGAAIVNDVSGLRDPALASVCAETGAALVLMHTRAEPKRRLQDPNLYEDVTEDVIGFLRDRMALAQDLGVAAEQLIVDPGPDFAKTPAQTVELMTRLRRLHELGRPILMAISRKDFVGALTGRSPADRLAGTLAALAHGADAGAHIFRVHDVAAAADFLTVRAALRGDADVAHDLALAEELRHEPARGGPRRLGER